MSLNECAGIAILIALAVGLAVVWLQAPKTKRNKYKARVYDDRGRAYREFTK